MRNLPSFHCIFLLIWITIVSAAGNDLTVVNQIAQRFNIPTLVTEAFEGDDLNWFESVEHLANDSCFVVHALASQLCEESDAGFKENRSILARHVFEQFLKRSYENDNLEAISKFNEWKIQLIRILLSEGKYSHLLRLIISYPKYWDSSFSSMVEVDFSGFFQFIKCLPPMEIKQFYHIVASYFDRFEKEIIYIKSFNQFIPYEYFLKDLIIVNFVGMHSSFLGILNEIDNVPNKMELIEKLEEILQYIVRNLELLPVITHFHPFFCYSESIFEIFPRLITEMEEHLEFIKLGPEVTLTELGINIEEMDDNSKFTWLFHSIQFGRENLRNELIRQIVPRPQVIESKLMKYVYEKKGKCRSVILPALFYIFNELYSEADMNYWHCNSSLFKVLLILSKVQQIDLIDTRSTGILFVNDAKDVALGVPDTFLHAQIWPLRATFAYDSFYMLKFETSYTFWNYLNQIELKRPDILAYLRVVPIQINAENLFLIMESLSLNAYISQLDLVFKICNLENIKVSMHPTVRLLGDIVLVDLNEDIIDKFKNTELQIDNLLTLTGKSIADLLLETVFRDGRVNINEGFYFKCRRVLAIWARRIENHRLQEIPYPILKQLLVKEHPNLKHLFN